MGHGRNYLTYSCGTCRSACISRERVAGKQLIHRCKFGGCSVVRTMCPPHGGGGGGVGDTSLSNISSNVIMRSIFQEPQKRALLVESFP